MAAIAEQFSGEPACAESCESCVLIGAPAEVIQVIGAIAQDETLRKPFGFHATRTGEADRAMDRFRSAMEVMRAAGVDAPYDHLNVVIEGTNRVVSGACAALAITIVNSGEF